MDKIKLEILGITYSQTQSGSYVLTLGEIGGKRKLPIVIGGFEAQAIAVGLEKMTPNRPLTHDLFNAFCNSFDIDVIEIIIHKFHEGIFHAKIICIRDGQIVEIDSRTSDAIAIGVRFSCSMYTISKVLNDVGNTKDHVDEDDEDDDDEDDDDLDDDDDDFSNPFADQKENFKHDSKSVLEEKLKLALENEDYERASILRDEINKRPDEEDEPPF